MSIIRELKRRNVFRVGAAYAVAAWLLLQVVDVVVPVIEAPDWVAKSLLLLLAIGFPMALILAWAFELTPEGLKFERDVDRSSSITANTGRKLDFVIIGILSIALVFFAIDKFFWQVSLAENAASEKRSIAVLPFANMSSDPDQLFFSDGISEEILNSLVRVKGISVASRTSSFKYRGEITSIPDIAEELGVLFILEGSVRKSGKQLRITAQLIDAVADRHLWSETYDRQDNEIFEIQSDIANSIAQAIQSAMGIEVSANIPTRHLTEDMDAYDLYLKGQLALQRRATAQDVLDSIEYLEQAVALDPEFADAWAYLAAAYSTAPSWTLEDDLVQLIRLSARAADRALALDPDQALAYLVKASNSTIDPPYDPAAEFHMYQLAIEKDEANPLAHNWHGIALLLAGYIDEGIAAQQRCLEIDPLYVNCLAHLSAAYHIQGRHDLAREATDALWELWSHFISGTDVPWLLLEGERRAAIIAAAHADGLSGAPYIDWIQALENPDDDHSVAYQRFRDWAANANVDLQDFPQVRVAFGDYTDIDIVAEQEAWYWLPLFRNYRASDEFKDAIRHYGYFAFWKESGYPPMCRPIGTDDFECD
jgi:TolB-like protein